MSSDIECSNNSLDEIVSKFQEWILPNKQELITQHFRGSENQAPERSMLKVDLDTNIILPMNLYLFLKLQFGDPNGLQMELKSQGVDNLIHWEWTLQCDSTYIYFIAFTFRVEIIFTNTSESSQKEITNFHKVIQKKISERSREITLEKRSLEKWNVIINPYNRLSDSVLILISELEELSNYQDYSPFIKHGQTDKNTINKLIETNNRIFKSGFSLKITLPIWCESFINLVLFVLAKDQIKKEDRLLKSVMRQQIDVRIKTLPIVCNGFLPKFRLDDKLFKEIVQLFSSRNIDLHGAIDIRKHTFDDMYFDGNIPLFARETNQIEQTIGNQVKMIDPKHLISNYESICNFIEMIITGLEDGYARSLIHIMNERNPGWDPTRKILGILFPKQFVDLTPMEKMQG